MPPRTPPLAQRLLCLPGKIASWLIIPLTLTILVSVVGAQAGWSVLLDWEGRIPLFGAALTVNSLIDFQWYAFALIVLFGGVWAFFEDRHVTVDFIAAGLRPRTRALINLFGDLFLLLPLCLLIIWYGSKFAAVSYRTGEGSVQGGLDSIWLIKGALPLSFGLLGIAALLRAFTTLRALRKPPETETDPESEPETPDAG